jgi:flagellar biosynthesis protein FlhB
MSQDKTEQPTAKRLQDARDKGQVARTREAGQAASLIAATLALGWVGQTFMARLADGVSNGIVRMGHDPTSPIDAAEVTQLAMRALGTVGLIVSPVAGAAVVTVIALHTAQGGWVFSSEALHMNWGRLNPSQGIKRLGLSKGGIDLLRAILSASMIGWLGYAVIRVYLDESVTLARMDPAAGAAYMWETAAALIRQVALGLLLLAGADFFVQRYQLRKSLMMTKQEIKDEFRNSEGNPEIKGRVRRIQREMFRRRMLTATKNATVVITNPTHFAIALEYRRDGMSAPIVVAKGQDHMAQRIKAVAREHGVPMVENVALARALYASAEIGDVIPGPLFEAVAEVLAYLIRIKQLVLS